MGAVFKVITVVLLAVCVHRILRIYILIGGFAHYNQHHPGPCKQVEGIQLGSEDFETLSSGQTFITSGLRYTQLSPQSQEHFKKHGIRGRIYLLDLRNLTQGVQELKISSNALFQADTFAPHGISIWEDKATGRHVVFVVNHRFQTGPMDSRVEKFVYQPEQQELVHQATFSDPSMTLVNDVQATGENSFYFTNCNYFRNMMGMLLETLLEMSLTNVVYFDGRSYTVVDSGLKSANGVAMSPDKKVVYVADMMSHEILVYRRNQDNTLTRTQEYPVYTLPDNIQVDQSTGFLYIACHPLLYLFHKYVGDIGAEKAPSQVLHLEVKNGVITSTQEVVYDHGQLISASSSAVVFEDTLLIGSVWDHLVTCQVQVPLFH